MNDKISKIQLKAGSSVKPGCLLFSKSQAVLLVPSAGPSCVSEPSWDHSPEGSCPLPPQPRGVTRREAESHPGDCTCEEGRSGLETSQKALPALPEFPQLHRERNQTTESSSREASGAYKSHKA